MADEQEINLPIFTGRIGERANLSRPATDSVRVALANARGRGRSSPRLGVGRPPGAQTIARHRPILYVENDRAELQGDLISLIDSFHYRQYWHAPSLFSPQNFNGVTENVFGAVASLNMLCIPR